MLCRDAACRVSPDREAKSQHPALLVKLQSWIAREQLALIAVAKITQEVRFPFAVRKELRIHLRGIKAFPGPQTDAPYAVEPKLQTPTRVRRLPAGRQEGKRIQPPKPSSSLFAPQEIASPATPERRLCTTQRPAQTRALCTRSHSRLRYNVCLLFPGNCAGASWKGNYAD